MCLGNQVHQTLAMYVAPLLLVFDVGQESQAVRQGTAVLVRFEGRAFLVSCDHVFREAREALDQKRQVTGFCSNLILSEGHFLERVSGRRDPDIATMSLTDAEEEMVRGSGKAFIDPGRWPPRRAQEGESIILFGHPEGLRPDFRIDVARRTIVGEALSFWVGGRVDSSSHRNIVATINLDEMRSESATGTIAELPGLGGMSGGGVFRPGPNATLLGFIYEARCLDDQAGVLYAHHADLILPDGSVDSTAGHPALLPGRGWTLQGSDDPHPGKL